MRSGCCFAFVVILLLCSFSSASAQENYKNKAFVSTIFSHYLANPGFNFTILQGMQGGFGWQNKKGSWHEAEINAFSLARDESTYGGLLGLRYQYSLMPFKKLQGSRVQPFIGFGGMNFINYYNMHNKSPFGNVSDLMQMRNFLEAYLSPGVDVALGKRFYSTFQIPVTLAQLEVRKDRITYTKPEVVVARNTYTDYKLLPFEYVYLRLSFGYKF